MAKKKPERVKLTNPERMEIHGLIDMHNTMLSDFLMKRYPGKVSVMIVAAYADQNLAIWSPHHWTSEVTEEIMRGIADGIRSQTVEEAPEARN